MTSTDGRDAERDDRANTGAAPADDVDETTATDAPAAEPAAVDGEPATEPVPEPVVAREPEPEPVVDAEPEPAAPADAEPVGAADAATPSEPAPPVTHTEPLEPPASEAPGAVDDHRDADESDDAQARLDAAVQRAKAEPEASGATAGVTALTPDAEPLPEPVAADSVRRETYVPPAAGAAAVGAATLTPEPAAYQGPQTIYVQAPERPKRQGNRGFGVLVALIGTVIFALLYAGAAYLVFLGQSGAESSELIVEFVSRPIYWVPIVAFFIGFALLAAIVNRGPWWTYAVFGLLVGVFVYFSYLGGALLTVEAWTLTPEQAVDFIDERWLDPFAVLAGVIAREIPIWLGGWIAARGRTVVERNRLADEEYERQLAAGPQPIR
ncbi:hypothetical protein GE115_09965 [Agromyces sp. CFH 90414]|uniref:Uncharacterized protein n=1 Tax=Agromyces agglutinans TaxID=2662258 RepID=A0A6I2FBW2_9MICO|nr:hypothetical protein [Agromyces agglutinans]MRG60190.1 hypothetical protein [Agromyces agglutinans]